MGDDNHLSPFTELGSKMAAEADSKMAARPGGPSAWVPSFPLPLEPDTQSSVEMEESSLPVGTIKEILKRSRSRKDRTHLSVTPQCWEVHQQVLLPTPKNGEAGEESSEEILEDDIETCVVSFENASDPKEERGTKTEVIVGPDCVITIEEEEVDLEDPDLPKPEVVLEDEIETCVVCPEENEPRKEETQSVVIDGGSIEDFVAFLEDTGLQKIDKAIQTDVMGEGISEVCKACIQKAGDSKGEELTEPEENKVPSPAKSIDSKDSKGEEETQFEKETQGKCKNLEAGDKGADGKTDAAILDGGGIVMETARQGFRWFRYQEAEGPRNAYRQLRELCCLWLKPESRTKEQILELLVLEQFLAILPQEIQSWVWQQHPETCIQAVDLVENFLTGISLLERHGKRALVTFEEVAVFFSEEEWRLLNEAQRKICRKVILENYENVKSLGFPVHKPDLIFRVENGSNQDLCLQDSGDSPEKPPLEVVGDAELSSESDCEELTTWKEKEAADKLAPVLRLPSALKAWEATVKSSPPSKQGNKPRWQRTEPRFGCPDCGKTFPWQSALARHQLSHSGEKTYRCSDCPKSFAQYSKLARHQRLHTGEAPCECPECGKCFCDRYKLARHRKIHSDERPYCCDICGRGFCLNSNLQQHRRVHTGERPHRCLECGRCFSRRSNLIQHLRVHQLQWQQQQEERQGTGLSLGDSELGPDFDVCGEEWEYEWIADTQDGEHMVELPMKNGSKQMGELLVENSKDEPISELCARNQEDEEILELRVGDYEHGWTTEISGRSHEQGDIMAVQVGNHEHQEALELCTRNLEGEEIVELCVGDDHKRGYNEKLDGENDDCLLVNNGGRFYPNCQESCPSPNAPSSQTLVPGAELPQCSDCGQTFTRNSSLSRHQLIHATERHACQECCRSFTLPSLLAQHQLTHSSGQPHLCPDCPKSFSHRSKLLRHQRSHTGERPFQCTDCGKSYRDNSTLLRHQRVHSNPQALGYGTVEEYNFLPPPNPVMLIL